MKMRILAVALLAAVPVLAHAETVTFKSQTKPGTAVQAPASQPGGRPYGGGTFTSTTDAVDSNGKKVTATASCMQWVLPASNNFGSSALCKYSDASGELYVSEFTCDPPGPDSECFGRLIGTGGVYKGRKGAFAMHNGPGSPGAGYWNDAPTAK